LIKWLQDTKLLSKYIKCETILQEGFILIYLPLFGSHSDPYEIILDDFVPMFSLKPKEYLYRLPRYNIIAMLLIEKALAKILGNYDRVRALEFNQIF